MSRSTSTQTVVRNGQRVTRTVTRLQHADGTLYTCIKVIRARQSHSLYVMITSSYEQHVMTGVHLNINIYIINTINMFIVNTK